MRLPLKYYRRDEPGYKYAARIVDADDQMITKMPAQDDNADDEHGMFIVRACNAHDALLAACKALLPYAVEAMAKSVYPCPAGVAVLDAEAAIKAASPPEPSAQGEGEGGGGE